MSHADVGEGGGTSLGGVGAGGMELGRDGRIRRVTINNNRTSKEAIPSAYGSFLAVRAAFGDDQHARILQTGPSTSFENAGIRAPFVDLNALKWDGLFPCSTYGLNDPQFPLRVSWRVLSPVLPYDTEAAELPAIMFIVQLRNASARPCNASVLFNWEDVRGCVGSSRPEEGAPMHLIYRNEKEELQATDTMMPGLEVLALAFGLGSKAKHSPARSTHEGDYTIAAAPTEGQTISFCGWRRESQEDLAAVWWAFSGDGKLPDRFTAESGLGCAALCLSQTIAANTSAKFSFILTWHCPLLEIEGRKTENGYALKYSNSVDVARYAVQHHKYFIKAVENWHQRFLKSSLPKWFSRLLLNSAQSLTTDTMLTKEGQFVLANDMNAIGPEGLRAGLYNSLGSLLFFPAYAQSELGLYASTEENPGDHGGIRGASDGGTPPDESVELELNAKLILCAARNYRMTGARARAMELYPASKAAARWAAARDTNDDGIPETVDGPADAYVSGLWVAAWCAMAYLARGFKHESEAQQYELLASKAASTFEKAHWPRESLTNENAERVEAASLAGPWYRRFLRLTTPPHLTANPREVAAAIVRNGSGPEQSALSADDRSATFLPAALIEFGQVEAGLEMLRRCGPLAYSPNALAAWHALYALEGFLLAPADKALYIAPNLPEGVKYLNAPVFTPSCLGWLTYQVDEADGYRQSIKVAFDSPIHIAHIELRVPSGVPDVEVFIECDGDVSKSALRVVNGPDFNEVLIDIPHPMLIQASVSITVVNTPRMAVAKR